MRVSANIRIQWLHEELVRNTYPNAARLAERFHISRRQAQRDIDFLKKQLGAPLEYDGRVMGYRYTKAFSLPVSVKNENDMGLSRMPINPFGRDITDDSAEADSLIIQGQIPYTATLGITDKRQANGAGDALLHHFRGSPWGISLRVPQHRPFPLRDSDRPFGHPHHRAVLAPRKASPHGTQGHR